MTKKPQPRESSPPADYSPPPPAQENPGGKKKNTGDILEKITRLIDFF